MHRKTECSEESLNLVAGELYRLYRQPVLIEEFLSGCEFNVCPLEVGGELLTLPISEISWEGLEKEGPSLVSYDAKWIENSPEYKLTPSICPAPINKELGQTLRTLAIETWKILEGKDCGGGDIRLEGKGIPFVLEFNPNLDISLQAGLTKSFTLEDRSPILDIHQRTRMFIPEEIEVARELIDAWMYHPEHKDYILYTSEEEGKVTGYVCYGPTLTAEGTFDLYWIAVDPLYQRSGIGKQLLLFIEKRIIETNGRYIVIETSSQKKYAPTHSFYERNGDTLEARIQDFYHVGDDRLIYVKQFPT